MPNAWASKDHAQPAASWRRLPFGAELAPGGGVHFRVWAPRRKRVEVEIDPASDYRQRGRTTPLTLEGDGYFAGLIPQARAGTRYAFWLDDEDRYFPDPASRFQPEGPHGPSEVVDPNAFSWTDTNWRGVSERGQVLYEMHIGTFTPDGTYTAAAEQLQELKALGVTIVEVMPVSDFCGRFGWGYDGVNLYAPTRLYGRPDDFRRFVDRAHEAGLGVILDVVYNHMGPDGNYLMQYSEDYFSRRHKSEWGDAPNFDGTNNAAVREFFSANAGYWIDEFHLDGLRLDATQQVYDDSPEHILAAITRRAQAAAHDRSIYLVAENEPQDVRTIAEPTSGGHGFTAMWNDDFHHAAIVAMTGRNEAYYTDYRGTPQELVSATKHGFLYQGQYYRWQKKRRGTPTHGVPMHRLVTFLENHDQVANTGIGSRCYAQSTHGRYRALTALLLLGPQTPMLFQGQEFGASTPFLYFADHVGGLAEKVREGRKAFVAQFASVGSAEMQARLPNPSDAETFTRCKLNVGERARNAPVYDLHRDLLRLRREDPALRAGIVDGAVLSGEGFVIRFFGDAGDDRLLLINLGRDLTLSPLPEPLLAPPISARWRILWSSEHPRYGGGGIPPFDDNEKFHVPGHSALLLTAEVAHA
jgi:maltooligosyltrehalose trehalohydrolase